jgi:hypothetical protein
MSEVGKMVTVIYGNESQKYGIVMKALKQEDHKTPLSQADFVKLTRKLPLLLFPIFKLLTVGEENTLGVKRWKEIRKLKEKNLSSSGLNSGKHLTKVGKISTKRLIKLDKSNVSNVSTKSDISFRKGSGSSNEGGPRKTSGSGSSNEGGPRKTSGSRKGSDGRKGSDPKASLMLGPGTRQGSSRAMEPKAPLRLGAGGRQASIDRFKSLEMSREIQGSFRERRKSVEKGPSFVDHKLISQTSRRGSHLGEFLCSLLMPLPGFMRFT